MFTDETNLTESRNAKFFIYGGLVVSAEVAGSLSHEIGLIRVEHGFRSSDPLKFRKGSREAHISVADWNDAKDRTIEACRDHGAYLVAALVLHGITRNRRDHLFRWQLDPILQVFNREVLGEHDDVGIFVMDRLGGNEYALMKEKFSGYDVTRMGQPRLYPNIVGYASTCDGASYLASATDVVLGTLGYCVNEQGDRQAPRELFPKIEPLIWRRQAGDRHLMWGHGLILKPDLIKSQAYQAEYEQLKRHVRSLSKQSD